VRLKLGESTACVDFMGLEQQHPDYSVIPTVVFSIPPLASVGLREETARARGVKFTVKHEDTSDWYSSRRIGNRHSGYKVLIDDETDRILGAHILSLPQMISLISLHWLCAPE
jgi:glutathione reductase (NADPH)